MQPGTDQVNPQNDGLPWYLIWVFGAIALAVVNVTEFRSTANLGSLLIAFGWLFWAFSWYAKPFRLRFRAKLSQAIRVGQLRAWIPQQLWNIATFGALGLLLVGLVLKFMNAA